jgi:hypothetical protein
MVTAPAYRVARDAKDSVHQTQSHLTAGRSCRPSACPA